LPSLVLQLISDLVINNIQRTLTLNPAVLASIYFCALFFFFISTLCSNNSILFHLEKYDFLRLLFLCLGCLSTHLILSNSIHPERPSKKICSTWVEDKRGRGKCSTSKYISDYSDLLLKKQNYSYITHSFVSKHMCFSLLLFYFKFLIELQYIERTWCQWYQLFGHSWDFSYAK
jgi:hypothetical protein